MKSIEEKAELWDYYQDLVKSSGFDGVTDLLAENKRLQTIIDAANQSTRITEQDAREIEDFLVEDYKREYVGQGIEAWLRSACRELLTKLNNRV